MAKYLVRPNVVRKMHWRTKQVLYLWLGKRRVSFSFYWHNKVSIALVGVPTTTVEMTYDKIIRPYVAFILQQKLQDSYVNPIKHLLIAL